jgi:hypothetical protein
MTRLYRSLDEALRAIDAGTGRLLADHRISPHFVEVSSAGEPSLSTEYRA